MKKLWISQGAVHAVAYSADGRWLVSLDSKETVRFWDLATFAERARLTVIDMGLVKDSLALHEDWLILGNALFNLPDLGKRLAEGGAASWVLGRDAFSVPIAGRYTRFPPRFALDQSRERLVGVGPPEGNLQGDPDRVQFWDLAGHPTGDVAIPHQDDEASLYGLAVSPDGNVLALARRTGVTLFRLTNGEVCHRFHPTSAPSAVCFSPDGSLLAVAAGRSVWLREWRAPRPPHRFPAFQRHVAALAFSPDGRHLAAGSRDGEVCFYDTEAFQEAGRYHWDIGPVNGLAFAPDGMTAAGAGGWSSIALWDLE